MCDTRVRVGCRVKGNFGPLVLNPRAVTGKPNRHVLDISASTSNHDSVLRNMRSSQLKITDVLFGLPLNEPPMKVSSC